MIVDLDRPAGRGTQGKLLQRFYHGYIPHVAIVDKNGRRLYDQAGEVEESELAIILDRALK